MTVRTKAYTCMQMNAFVRSDEYCTDELVEKLRGLVYLTGLGCVYFFFYLFSLRPNEYNIFGHG